MSALQGHASPNPSPQTLPPPLAANVSFCTLRQLYPVRLLPAALVQSTQVTEAWTQH